MSIDAVGALLLISDDVERLAAFYREGLGLPLEPEVHDGVPLHHGCEIGSVHLAIHPSAEWPGQQRTDAQSPVIVLHTDDVQGMYERLVAHGIQPTPPFDHGFAVLIAFQDPDGNHVQVMTPTPTPTP